MSNHKDHRYEMYYKMILQRENLELNERTPELFLFQLIQTSKVISSMFLGICRTPVSPSSPEIHIQGLAVNIEPPSFLLGTINIWYGITANTRRNNTSEVKKENNFFKRTEEKTIYC